MSEKLNLRKLRAWHYFQMQKQADLNRLWFPIFTRFRTKAFFHMEACLALNKMLDGNAEGDVHKYNWTLKTLRIDRP